MWGSVCRPLFYFNPALAVEAALSGLVYFPSITAAGAKHNRETFL